MSEGGREGLDVVVCEVIPCSMAGVGPHPTLTIGAESHHSERGILHTSAPLQEPIRVQQYITGYVDGITVWQTELWPDASIVDGHLLAYSQYNRDVALDSILMFMKPLPYPT